MSSRPARKPSFIASEKPSVNVSCASGSRLRNSRTSGTATSFDKLGGKPIDTRPASAPRTLPNSSRASAT